ncbi:hypothetical protein Tco_0324780 [Tanacetum coccineum]
MERGNRVDDYLVDASRGLCKCGNDESRSLQNGTWSSVMSPYEQRFIDVKYTSAVYGSVIVTLLEGKLVLTNLRDFSVCAISPSLNLLINFYSS